MLGFIRRRILIVVIVLLFLFDGVKSDPNALYIATYSRLIDNMRYPPQLDTFRPLNPRPPSELNRVLMFFPGWRAARRIGPATMRQTVESTLRGQISDLLHKTRVDLQGPLHHEHVVLQEPVTLQIHLNKWSELVEKFQSLQTSPQIWEQLQEIAGEEVYQEFLRLRAYAMNMENLLLYGHELSRLHYFGL